MNGGSQVEPLLIRETKMKLVLILVLAAATGWANDWSVTPLTDRFTGAPFVVFALQADGPVARGIYSTVPMFLIYCANGKWNESQLKFGSGMLLARDVNQHNQMTEERNDDKIHVHFWNVADDFSVFFVDRKATRDLIYSKITRIKFADALGRGYVADFTPHGMNFAALREACGKAFEK
jgi:hypothetical protein